MKLTIELDDWQQDLSQLAFVVIKTVLKWGCPADPKTLEAQVGLAYSCFLSVLQTAATTDAEKQAVEKFGDSFLVALKAGVKQLADRWSENKKGGAASL